VSRRGGARVNRGARERSRKTHPILVSVARTFAADFARGKRWR
jgi:hypothetical protein